MNPLEALLGSMMGSNNAAPSGGGMGPLLQIALQLLSSQGGGAGAGGLGGGGGMGGMSGMGGMGGMGGLGGLGALIQQFQQAGLGGQMDSWISTGQNLPISPEQLTQALGHGRMQEMAATHGMDSGQLAGGLSQILPQLIDGLTPQGQVPSGGGLDSALAELSRMMPRG